MIGITGGIGSGKSTVCKIFEVLGADIYDADTRAKWLMENDPALTEEIQKLFGKGAYEDGKLNRAFIASQVYVHDSLREKLNGLVHPAVGRDVKAWAGSHQDSKLLLKEAALLFETDSYKQLDKTILVTAPKEMRIERVVARDSHRSASDVEAIISKQLTDEEKIPLADFVIKNDGEASLIRQVCELYNKLVVT